MITEIRKWIKIHQQSDLNLIYLQKCQILIIINNLLFLFLVVICLMVIHHPIYTIPQWSASKIAKITLKWWEKPTHNSYEIILSFIKKNML